MLIGLLSFFFLSFFLSFFLLLLTFPFLSVASSIIPFLYPGQYTFFLSLPFSQKDHKADTREDEKKGREWVSICLSPSPHFSFPISCAVKEPSFFFKEEEKPTPCPTTHPPATFPLSVHFAPSCITITTQEREGGSRGRNGHFSPLFLLLSFSV